MAFKSQSPLELDRLIYKPALPSIFLNMQNLHLQKVESENISEEKAIAELFPHTWGQPLVKLHKGGGRQNAFPLKVGVVLSGGQAPGGHNVIAGLFDALKKLSPESNVFGYLNGPGGVVRNQLQEISHEMLADYRNTGGFDMIGSGREKIESGEHLSMAMQSLQERDLNGLVIIGGDDSNTNAAILAEYLLAEGSQCCIIGVPKTIDGDLKRKPCLETSFGFDTACKTFSETIGNIARDAISAKKYYHFVRLMGRSASHITLECALQTHPNLALIGEEAAAGKMTLTMIVKEIADLVCQRAENGKNYGVVLIPEGLIEFVPEIKILIKEINALLADGIQIEEIAGHLSKQAKDSYDFLPEKVQKQILLDRDPHGNVRVSQIATEELLISALEKELARRSSYKGAFNPLSHFLGYEGRSAFPSFFDTHYCYALGHMAAVLIHQGASGYMASLAGLANSVESWEGIGIPFASLIHIEERKGKRKPVIQKALVDLNGAPFLQFANHRDTWKIEDCYRYPGPIQFYGPPSLCEERNFSLLLEQEIKTPA